jgi:CheY-like chemotaxis protein
MNTSPYINILIADDDQDDAAFLAEGISKIISSFKVFNASNGLECLNFLEEHEAPELIFLDINMPLRNGIECLMDIRKNKELRNSHVIMYSTSSSESDINTCYELGAKFYIIKPVTFSGMVNMLKQLFVGLGKPVREIACKEKFLLTEQKLVWVR